METVDIKGVNTVLRKKFINGQMRSMSSRGMIQGEINDIFFDPITSYIYVAFWWYASYREFEEDDCIVGTWHILPEHMKQTVGSRIKMTASKMKLHAEMLKSTGRLTIFEPDKEDLELLSRCDFFPPGHEEGLSLEWIEGAVTASTH